MCSNFSPSAKTTAGTTSKCACIPAFIRKDHPLASVGDSFNAVFLQGDSVGDIMLYGRGAGALPTGSAIVSDVIYAATHSENKYATFRNTQSAEPGVKFVTGTSAAATISA